jgi:hypothetical protein
MSKEFKCPQSECDFTCSDNEQKKHQTLGECYFKSQLKMLFAEKTSLAELKKELSTEVQFHQDRVSNKFL